MVMGRALYDLPGLTFQGELPQFWSTQSRVNQALWRRFRAFLITQTQLNGAFYGRDFHALTKQAEQRVADCLHALPITIAATIAKKEPMLEVTSSKKARKLGKAN
jgi:hypothetical protein